MLEKKHSLKEIAGHQQKTVETVLGRIEKMLNAGIPLQLSHLRLDRERYHSIKKAFDQVGCSRLKPVYDKLDQKVPFEELRLARLLIGQMAGKVAPHV
jgi:hypothetical protein